MFKANLSLLCAFLLVLSSCKEREIEQAAPKDVETNTEQLDIFGHKVEVTRITGVNISHNKFKLSDIFGDVSQDVFLSMANDGHVALMFDNKRFDGELFLRKIPKFKVSTDRASPGLLIRIPNVPQQVIDALNKLGEKYRGNKYFATCIHAACSILDKAGISILNKFGLTPASVTGFLTAIFSNSVYDDSGNTVGVNLYVVGDQPIEVVVKDALARENKELMKVFTVVTAPLMTPYAAGAAAGTIVLLEATSAHRG